MMHAVALAGFIRQQLGPKTVLRAAVAEDAGEHLIQTVVATVWENPLHQAV